MSDQTFTLPDLGEGLTEAQLVRWLVAVGDTISVDTPVAEVETAKAVVEVPTPYGGRVAELHVAEGATLLVGEPLITVASGQPARSGQSASTYVEEERAGSGNVLVGYGTTATTHGRRGRLRKAPAPPRDTTGQRPRTVSPLVRKLAKDKGIDLGLVRGTGAGGLITRRDVERANTPTHPETPSPNGLPVRERIPLRGVRAAIAATLSRSRREIPEATTWVDVDATALLAVRDELRSRGDQGPGLLALLARFVVAGLHRYPVLNSRVDTQAGEIHVLDGVNLGIATQTDRGLVVPVVRDAHRHSARSLGAEIHRVVTAARDDGATGLTGGSFTLNNYGAFGVDGSAAIINHPEVAILGIGRIMPRPWVVADEVVPRQITQLSLVFDHRVCDGGTAAGFLRFVADTVEAPHAALADL